MVKFAHLSDCHLGCWRQEELQALNFKSFQKIISLCLEEKVEFILIAGDLFDSAYPPIDILKDVFQEFKRIKDAKIPVYLIAGSHDFSASGKTFLGVLEKAGFCKNLENYEVEEDGRIKLFPTFHGDIVLYGYPGKKSGMEMEDLKKVYFEQLNKFTIFVFHTTIKDVVGTVPMDFIEKEELPLADYYAMGHIHKRYDYETSSGRYVYPGPTFPANFQELVDLKCGSFQILNVEGSKIKSVNITVPIKEVTYLEIDIDNGLTATSKIISEIDKLNLRNKILLLKLKGVLNEGKTGDIRFGEIEDFIKKKEIYATLRNISSLKIPEANFETNSFEDNPEMIERRNFDNLTKRSPSNFNKYLQSLVQTLSLEKNEDEKSAIYEDRLLSELKDILKISKMIQ